MPCPQPLCGPLVFLPRLGYIHRMSRTFWSRFFISLFGLPVLFVAAAYLFATQYVQTQDFSQRLARILSAVAERECRIDGSISIGLWPEPHIRVNDAVFMQPAAFAEHPPFLRVETLEVFLAYSLLREGQLAIDEFRARRPRMLLLHNAQNGGSGKDILARLLPQHAPHAAAPELRTATATRQDISTGSGWLKISPQLTFQMENADLIVRNLDTNILLHLVNLNLLLQAGDNGLRSLEAFAPVFMWGDVSVIEEKMPDAGSSPPLLDNSIRTMRVSILSLQETHNMPHLPPAYTLAAEYTVLAPDTGLNAHVQLNSQIRFELAGFTPAALKLDTLKLDAEGTVQATGTFTRKEATVPFSVHAPFYLDSAMDITLTGAKLRFEHDGGTLNARITGLSEGAPRMEGTAQVDNFSLPRWFYFGRILPSGLMHTLNSMSGELDFCLTPEGVNAPRIDAVLSGIPLHGKAEAVFDTLSMHIDAATEFGDINTIFPEMFDDSIVDPVFPGPPLLTADEADDLPMLDFSVNVRAQNVHIWHFDLGGFFFRCSPSAKGIMLNFAADDIYGGRGKLNMDIIDDYDITLTAENIRLDEPLRIMSGFDAATGFLDAQGSFFAEYGTMARTMASLTGTAEGTLRDGRLQFSPAPDAPHWEFSTLHLWGNAKGAGLPASGNMPDELPWTGDWKVHTRTPAGLDWDFSAQGTLIFDTATGLPIRMHEVDSSVSATLPPALSGLPHTLPLAAHGLLSLDTDADTFDLSQATINMADITAYATISGTGLNSRLNARADFDIPHVSPAVVLNLLDAPQWLPADRSLLQAASLNANLVLEGSNARLNDIQLNWGGSRFSGNISRQEQEAPFWNLDLHADSLDLDRWLPEDEDKSPDDWPLEWLASNNAHGVFRADELLVHKVTLHNAVLPFRLNNGEFVAENSRAELGGGVSSSTIRFTVSDGLLLNIVSQLDAVDIAQASWQAAGGTYIGGTASVHLDLAGTLRSSRDIPSALSGSWSTRIENGFYATQANADTPSIPVDDRTLFTTAQATGILQNGIAYNDDLRVEGTSTLMTGKGWLDLVGKTLDYTVEVTFSGVPTVPVRLTGSLNEPSSSVQAGRMFTRTMGNIGAGAFGILGGIFSLPLRALEALGDPDIPPPVVTEPTELDSLLDNR